MPALHCGMFVGRVVVHDQMKLLVIRSGIVNEAQELNPFLMPVSIQAHADHLAVVGRLCRLFLRCLLENALTAPLISYNGVLNKDGKSWLTAGQAFTLTGCNLTGASVTINGVPAKLSSSAPTQISGVAPEGIGAG